MEFKTFDRLILLNILPKEGNYTDIKIVRKLREELSFDEAEQAALQLTLGEGGAVKWKPEADLPKEIEIGPRAKVIIEDLLKKLDKEGKIKEEHLSLYEKFVEEN